MGCNGSRECLDINNNNRRVILIYVLPHLLDNFFASLFVINTMYK